MFRLTGWVLLRLFNGFFWSIQIHKGQLEMVKKAATEVSSKNTENANANANYVYAFSRLNFNCTNCCSKIS